MEGIQSLPLDVLILIFEKLRVGDLLIASLVNKFWYEVIAKVMLTPKFEEKVRIKISHLEMFKLSVNDNTAPIKYFINSNRRYYHLQLEDEFKFTNCIKLFTKFGETIQALQLCGNQLDSIELFQLLNVLKIPLKEFEINFSIVGDENNFVEEFYNYCDNNTILSKIKKLDISVENDEVTYKMMLKLLEINHSTVKSLILRDLYEADEFLKVWEKVNLEVISICSNWSDLNSFRKILSLQTHLTELNLETIQSESIECSDFEFLTTTLPLLTTLKLYFWDWNDFDESGVTRYDYFKYLTKFKYLENFNLISEQPKLGPDEIIEIFGGKINKYIKRLKLESENFTNDQFRNLMLCFPNLVDLYVAGEEGTDIKDDTVQCIIKNLKHLKHLTLDSHEWITDYGLTGIVRETGEKTGHSIHELTRLEKLDLTSCQRLTDFTLINSIKFIDLREIVLFDNESFSADALKVVIANCPSLEHVLCNNSTWEHIRLIKSIPRLKTFGKICNICDEKEICTRYIKSYTPADIFEPFCGSCGFKIFHRNVRRTPVFRNLPKSTVFQVFRNMEQKVYERNEYIIRQGEHCDKYFFLIRGQARLKKCIGTKAAKMSYLTKCSSINVRALQGETLQPQNIVCSKPSTLCFVIDSTKFHQVISECN